MGVLLNNQWSIGSEPLRPAVNTFLAQPFINYNMAHGWFLTSAPLITANWLAAPGQQWTVTIAGVFGRIFRLVHPSSRDAREQAQYVNDEAENACRQHARAVISPDKCSMRWSSRRQSSARPSMTPTMRGDSTSDVVPDARQLSTHES